MGSNEWPLILFTVLAQTAVGAFWVQAVFLLKPGTDQETAKRLALGTLPLWILMACAFAASSLHLGMPFRGINALARVGQAALSNEIVTGGAFFALGSAYWWMSYREKGSASLRRSVLIVTTAVSVLFLAAMSSFYLMPTVPTWNTPLTPAAFFLTALIAGMLLGRERLCAAGFATNSSIGRTMVLMAGTAVLFSVIVTITQAASLAGINSSIQSAADLVPAYAPLMASRYVMLVLALIGWWALEQRPTSSRRLFVYALVPVLLGEAIGRGVFYELYMSVGL